MIKRQISTNKQPLIHYRMAAKLINMLFDSNTFKINKLHDIIFLLDNLNFLSSLEENEKTKITACKIMCSVAEQWWNCKQESLIFKMSTVGLPFCASMTAGSTWARSAITLLCFSLITLVWVISACWISCDVTFLRSASCWSFT